MPGDSSCGPEPRACSKLPIGVSKWIFLLASWTRPVGVANRALLVADHVGNSVWRILPHIAGKTFEEPRLLVFCPGDCITVRAMGPARLMFLGGRGIGGSTLHLVEFRVLAQGEDRLGERGLEDEEIRTVAGRDRIDSASRKLIPESRNADAHGHSAF